MTGQVVSSRDERQRPAEDPFRIEEKERAEFARRVSEFDPERVGPEPGSPFERYEAEALRRIEER
ncbi:hypothetical protein [Nocardioides sp. TF02-7]|uniref:hypothetical protein n=1 Tax=Nocardioides sp. TF02-7 TaxID=2917724 RepID=UPI001F054175|nr:hypothetical protein [Nocardioides sp. TF02-7]UMG92838.1 hypothetical protein MF408_00110 [Nocardioides sp. TF02-7]